MIAAAVASATLGTIQRQRSRAYHGTGTSLPTASPIDRSSADQSGSLPAGGSSRSWPRRSRVAASSRRSEGSRASRSSTRLRSSSESSETPSTYAASSSSSPRCSRRIGTPEDLAQPLHRVVEVHLRRILGAVRELGHLFEREIVEHAQLEDELLLRGQLDDRRAQPCAVLAIDQSLGHAIADDERVLGKLRRFLTPMIAQPRERAVDRDPVDPAAHRRGAAKARETLERAHERLLRDIGRVG